MLTEAEFFEIYANILKQNKTPVVNVDAMEGEVIVPRDCVDEDGSIQLCISPEAVTHLKVSNDVLYCRATFDKKVFCLSFPLANVIEILKEEEMSGS